MKLNGTEVPATPRQIDHWVRRGYLRPTNPAPGNGVPYRWTPAETRIAEMVALLVHAGVTPAIASHVARQGGRDVWVTDGVYINVCLPCAAAQQCALHTETEPDGIRQTDGEGA